MRTRGTLSLSEKLMTHIYQTKPVLNWQAVFTDGGPNFVDPMEPEAGDTVRLRIRTARDNADHVHVCMGDERIRMEIVRQTDLFDYYEASIVLGDQQVDYYYEVSAGGLLCYFNKKGPSRILEPFFNYKLTPGFSTPAWAKGAVMYQIFVERFANGDPSNDVLDHEYVYINEHVSKVTDWDKYPAKMGVREFYGGDLQGILDHLDYLCDLGVDVLYLNPVFVSPSNHKYDIQDYDYIDPHFAKIVVDEGELLDDDVRDNIHAARYINRVTDLRNLEASNAFFARFVEEVHKRGMRVILDGVFNHCGSFNKWMDVERIYEYQQDYEKGAYVEADSPYHDFFRFYDYGSWPYNDDYDGWWGHRTLPKLNYEGSDRLYDYILEIGRKWVSPPYNVDGWRLDVAADLGQSPEMNHRFWRDFRKAVKEANPEAIVLAEHYGDPADWLQGDQWDTIMNYNAFMEPVTWLLTGMEKHSDERRGDLLGNTQAFQDAMIYHMSRMHYPSVMVSMNELSNHDHSRFLTRTNQMVGRTGTLGPEAADQGVDKAVMRTAVLIQMTWPGAPTVYYGDEAGVTGWTDPDNRRTYPWGHEDREMIRFHRDMIAIHKRYKALMSGSLKWLPGTDRVLCYGRFTDDEKMVIVINTEDDAVSLKVAAWETGVTDDETMEQVIINTEEGYDTRRIRYETERGILALNLPAHSSILLKAVKKRKQNGVINKG